MAIAVRASRFAYVNNSNTCTILLPTGTAAGDTLVAFAGHGFQMSAAPTGFDTSSQTNISNFNGGSYVKIPVSAADVTAGSVTINFTGAFYGHVILIAFTGAITGVSAKVFGSSSAGAASRTLTTSTAPLVGEYVLYLAMGRVNGAITSSAGAALVADNQANASMVCTGGLVTVAGAQSSTFSYSVTPGGEYQAILVLSETVGPAAQEMEIANEVLYQGTPAAQEMEIAAEVLRGATASAQIMEIGVEVLRSITTVLRRRPVMVTVEVIADAGVNYSADTLYIDGSLVNIDTDTVEFT